MKTHSLVWFWRVSVGIVLLSADLLPCTVDVCHNGGSCYKKGDENICVCAPGFTGQFCDTGAHTHTHTHTHKHTHTQWPHADGWMVWNNGLLVVFLQMWTSVSRTPVWTEPPAWTESTPSPASACRATRESSANKVSCTWEDRTGLKHTESTKPRWCCRKDVHRFGF